MSDEKKTVKCGELRFVAGKPLVLSDSDRELPQITEKETKLYKAIGITLDAFLKAISELVSGKYASVSSILPSYLRNPCTLYAICCQDGLILRYEQHDPNKKPVYVGMCAEKLSTILPKVSESLLFCPENPATFVPPSTGISFVMSTKSPNKSQEEKKLDFKFYGIVSKEIPPQGVLPPPNKPFCAIGVGKDSFSIILKGEEFNKGEILTLGKGKSFLIRFTPDLPVGWKRIEVYPIFHEEYWHSEYARQWAEYEILSAIVQQNLIRADLERQDPMANARKKAAIMLKQFKELLDSQPNEETLQKFLESNPQMICPVVTKLWAKLKIGSFITDFVYLEPPCVYTLVELERPDHVLFRKDGQQTEDLTHAIDQITNWKRFLEVNPDIVKRELKLEGISTDPQKLVVIGRSATLSQENRRKLTTIMNNQPKLTIMTYDDLYERAKTHIENLLGPLWETAPGIEIYYPDH